MRFALAEFLFRAVAGRPSMAFVGPQRAVRWPLIAAVFTIVTAGAIALIVWAFWIQAISSTQAAYLVLLCSLFTVNFILFLRSIEVENRLGIESHWGGLGGGLGGWRISSSVTFLIITVAIFALLVVAIGSTHAQADAIERYRTAINAAERERYRSAINTAEREGIRFTAFETVGQKLVVKGSAPTLTSFNHLWDQVKLANPFYDDIVVAVAAPAVKAQGQQSASEHAAPAPAGAKSTQTTTATTAAGPPHSK
jgi:uncharacterized membrane protein